MSKKVVVLSAILMAFVCLANINIEAKNERFQTKSKSDRAVKIRKKVSDETLLLYGHVFHMRLNSSSRPKNMATNLPATFWNISLWNKPGFQLYKTKP